MSPARRGRGDGSLTEVRPGVWRLRVYVGTDPVTHRPIQASKTVTGKRTEALRELRVLAKEVDEGQHKATKSTTVAFLLARWQETTRFREELRPTTRQDYARVIKNHLAPALGAIELRKLNAFDIDGYFQAKRDAGMKGKTLRLHHSILSGALEQAVKWGWIPTNPAKSATPPKIERVRGFTPEVEQVRRLIDAAEDDHELATAVMLAAITGCRRGELCGLQWPDVDWETGVLTVRRQRVPVEGGDVTGPLKSKEVKHVALGPAGLALLDRYRQLTEERAVRLGVEVCWGEAVEGWEGSPTGWLLSRDCGRRPLNARGLGTQISQLGRRAGVPVTPHAFRRFAATQMMAGVTDVVTAAARLGHNPAELLRSYARPVLERNREAGAALEALVLSSEEGTDR